jgi:hypothetical protein
MIKEEEDDESATPGIEGFDFDFLATTYTFTIYNDNSRYEQLLRRSSIR